MNGKADLQETALCKGVGKVVIGKLSSILDKELVVLGDELEVIADPVYPECINSKG